MIDLIYFSPEIRCYRDGSVERLDKRYKCPRWRIVENTDNVDGYNHIKINNKWFLRQRIIASCFLGFNIQDHSKEIDHINRNRLGNSVDNLRILDGNKNRWNNNAKGFYFREDNGKWMAVISVNNKRIYLGQFDNEADASKAYQDAKLIYHVI
jgi:hypothetical protein